MLEEIFGEKNDLVEKALTHPSFTKENDINSLENYERLEFFGDSVLKLFTSKLLYEIYPEAPEGELSKIRSILVSDAILAQIAIQIGVDKLLKLGPSEEKQGGRKRESNIACALEALLGAYYLNGKQTEIEKFIKDYVRSLQKMWINILRNTMQKTFSNSILKVLIKPCLCIELWQLGALLNNRYLKLKLSGRGVL